MLCSMFLSDFLQYRSRFSMPGYNTTESLYYSFDLGPVHFVAITTEVYYFGPKHLLRINQQYQWLVEDLKVKQQMDSVYSLWFLN